MTEPARKNITLRLLLSHQSGLIYGFQSNKGLNKLYSEKIVQNAYTGLGGMKFLCILKFN